MGVNRQSTDRQICAVTCHFNWGGYSRPVQNLHRFVRCMERDGIELYGIELHFIGKPSRMKGHANWTCIPCSEKNIMFQKETLINKAVRELVPERFSKIVWVDADLFFSNGDWPTLLEQELDEYPFIQPFEECVWTGKLGGVLYRRASCGKSALNKMWKSHPGFAWASNKDFFTSGPGLYEYCIVGSGDTIFTCGLQNTPTLGRKGYGTGMPSIEKGILESWRKEVKSYKGNGKISYIPGRIYHEFHGTLENRNYRDRAGLVEHFDPEIHVLKNDDGILEWTDKAPEQMMHDVKNYFIQRNDDDA